MSNLSSVPVKRPAASLSLYDDDDDYAATSTTMPAAAADAKRARSADDKNAAAAPSTVPSRPVTFVTACGSRKGDREEMQDRHCVEENFEWGAARPVDDTLWRCGFFALFDGHAGSAAAEFCAKNFGRRLASQCARSAQAGGGLAAVERSMKKTFIDSYKAVDDEFLCEAKKRRPTLKDGTTATTILLLNDVLYSANIGDSRVSFTFEHSNVKVKALWAVAQAIVCRLKEDAETPVAMQLTVDHSPLAFNERMRIQKAGGVVKDGRVMGVLEVSRSIGDGQFKAHGVSCVPDIKKLTLTPDDLFIVLACDGLWKTFSSEDALKFILGKYAALKKDAKFLDKIASDAAAAGETAAGSQSHRHGALWTRIADDLSAEAVLRGCGDNVSVVLVVFTAGVERRLDGVSGAAAEKTHPTADQERNNNKKT